MQLLFVLPHLKSQEVESGFGPIQIKMALLKHLLIMNVAHTQSFWLQTLQNSMIKPQLHANGTRHGPSLNWIPAYVSNLPCFYLTLLRLGHF